MTLLSYFVGGLLILTAYSPVSAHLFTSLDPFVNDIIIKCEVSSRNKLTLYYKTYCQETLGCILRTVDNNTTARWSAGASVLAFIPTIAAMVSNTVDEVIVAAEENLLLGLLLSICSITTFTARFGRSEMKHQPVEEILAKIKYHVRKLPCEPAKPTNGFSSMLHNQRLVRRIVLGVSYFTLLAGCAAIWYAVYRIRLEGVIIFSCALKFWIPLWVALTQFIALLNVLGRRLTWRHENINFATDHFTFRVVLRCRNSSIISQGARGLTSVMSFALYAYATCMLGSMTMFTASVAIWCMALFAGAVGLSRIICEWAGSAFGSYKTAHVVEVPERFMEETKKRIEGIQQADYVPVKQTFD